MTYRILVVDDSAMVRTLHAYTLRADGFETVEADSGFAALEALHQEPCDLAVIDMNMPRMDGLTLVRQLRADPVTRQMPIIVISTRQEARDQRLGFEAGVNAYMVKPTDPGELVAQVRMLLRT
jgi:two-component system chemotaxis response regulator CheY